jgi:predicted metal-dependent phosphotriesterase family hydrolase
METAMFIRTVLGDIPASELGTTTCHEHLLWVVPEPFAEEDPDLGFDSIPAAVAELRKISIVSGVHLIAATGHHKDAFSARCLQNKSVAEIAARIVTDIQTGMNDTDIRAGHVHQILLSGNTVRKSAWHTHNPRVKGSPTCSCVSHLH